MIWFDHIKFSIKEKETKLKCSKHEKTVSFFRSTLPNTNSSRKWIILTYSPGPPPTSPQKTYLPKKFLKLTEKPNFSNKNIFHARLNEPTNQTKKRLHKHTYPKKDNFSHEKISHNCLEEPITWHTHLTYQNNNFSKHVLERTNFSPKGKVFYIYTKK